jgi:hypothetical protein
MTYKYSTALPNTVFHLYLIQNCSIWFHVAMVFNLCTNGNNWLFLHHEHLKQIL